MTKHSYFPYTSTYSSTIQTENTISITSLTQTHNILQHSKAKNTISNNVHYTPNLATDPNTVTTTNLKTNMHHIHTSIVSRHLATRGNNKMLPTHPPHISSSEEILSRLTRCTLAYLRTSKSPFLKSYTKIHPSPLCPLCNTHKHITHLFNCTNIRTTLSPLDLWTDSARVASQMDWEPGWWITSGRIGLHPLARVMGVGRHNMPIGKRTINR